MQEPLKEMIGIDVAELIKSYASRTKNNQNVHVTVPEKEDTVSRDEAEGEV